MQTMKKTFIVFAGILLTSSTFNAVNAISSREEDRYVNVIMTQETSGMKDSTTTYTRAIKGISMILFGVFLRG
jgi:hypothetical protein